MSGLERRLQLLLDHERYERVASEAHRTGRSVSAMIREAIDVRFPDSSDERFQAMRGLLADTAQPDPTEPVEDWAVSKQIYADDLDRRLLT